MSRFIFNGNVLTDVYGKFLFNPDTAELVATICIGYGVLGDTDKIETDAWSVAIDIREDNSVKGFDLRNEILYRFSNNVKITNFIEVAINDYYRNYERAIRVCKEFYRSLDIEKLRKAKRDDEAKLYLKVIEAKKHGMYFGSELKKQYEEAVLRLNDYEVYNEMLTGWTHMYGNRLRSIKDCMKIDELLGMPAVQLLNLAKGGCDKYDNLNNLGFDKNILYDISPEAYEMVGIFLELFQQEW